MQIDDMTVLKLIREFVACGGWGGAVIEPDTPLLREGYLNSFSLVELIMELEERLRVDLSSASFLPDDFHSVHSLCRKLNTL